MTWLIITLLHSNDGTRKVPQMGHSRGENPSPSFLELSAQNDILVPPGLP